MQMNFFEQMKTNLDTTIEKNYQSDKDFIKTQHQLIERDTITDIDFGPWGVKWRGANIPISDSSFENDHTAQFGFTCAGCGESAVNQDKLIHGNNCDSKSPHHRKEE